MSTRTPVATDAGVHSGDRFDGFAQQDDRGAIPREVFEGVSPRRLLRLALRSRRSDLVAACVLYSTHQLGEALVPVVIGLVISHAVDGGGWPDIACWLLVLGADFAFLSLSYRFGARASMRAKQHTGHAVRLWLSDRVLAPEGGVRNAPGDLLSRASSDATRVGAYAGMLAMAVAAVVVLIATTVLLLAYSLLLGAVILVGTVVLLAAQNLAARVLRGRSLVEQHEQARATALAEDIVRGLRVLKGIGAEDAAARDYRRSSRRAVAAGLHATSSAAAVAVVGTALSGIYLVVIVAVGGWLALSGDLGLGQLVSALGLAQFVIGPMQVLSTANVAYTRALASAARIGEVLSVGGVDGRRLKAASAPAGSGRLVPGVRLVDVCREDERGFEISLLAGQLTAVVCADASVTARVTNLLAREVGPGSSQADLLYADGAVSADALTLDQWRHTVLVSPHEAALFPGTIAENVSLLSADPAVVAAAVHAAFADQVIDAVADGEQAQVGDRGQLLSGGQRQRIALARALAAGAPVLVLPDPTTAVDAATEDLIARRTCELRSGMTTVVLTRSPAWLARCDCVIHLGRHGTSVGRHAELLADDAEYRAVVAR